MRLFEFTMPFAEVVELFKKEEAEEIAAGCERDYCMDPVNSFAWFAAQHGYKVAKIQGAFKADKPLYDIEDFHDRELDKMQEEGFNPKKKSDRIKFAKKHDMVDSLKVIPHYWNEYNGKIIDFTAQTQFVDSGLATDTDPSRYTKELPKSFF